MIVYGAEFQLTIGGVNNRFIKEVKERQMLLPRSSESETKPSDFSNIQTDRSGLWKDVWESCETGVLKNIFDKDTVVVHLESNENLATIDISVAKNEHEIDFNIDSSSIYMYSSDNDIDKTIYLESVSDTETLFCLMRDFVVQNS